MLCTLIDSEADDIIHLNDIVISQALNHQVTVVYNEFSILHVDIANAGGKYKYRKHLYHDTAKSVLIFPKIERFNLEELDELEDSDLMDLYYEYSCEVKKMSLDEFVDNFNRCNESVMDKYVKFIG